MPGFSVFLALKCFAGSECSPRRYIPICQSNRQQSNRLFLNNMKVLYLEWNRVLLRREQRVSRGGARALPRGAGPPVRCRCRADPRNIISANTRNIPHQGNLPRELQMHILKLLLFKSFPLWKSRKTSSCQSFLHNPVVIDSKVQESPSNPN